MSDGKLYRKGLYLEYLTVGCNIAEAVAFRAGPDIVTG